MNTKKSALFLASLALILLPLVTSANTDNSRYFVKTNSNLWKKSFGVRHTFNNGFSSDLGEVQLRLARIFNIEVEKVGRFYVLPGDFTETKTSEAPSQSITWGASRVLGSTVSVDTEAGKGVKVAVLDTGVSRDHSDLKKRIASCVDFSGKNPIMKDSCEDKNGHGTHVAGIIAADGGEKNEGIYGLAPAVSIYAYKVCDNTGVCLGDDVAAAIRMAVDQKVHIINFSIGSEFQSPLVKDAIAYASSKGILMIASAGNDGPYTGSIDFPALSKSVIAVGAVDKKDEVQEWSSRGTNSESRPGLIEDTDIELAAPGVGIESTWPDGGYAVLSGTSMAAPHVTGLAARLWRLDGKDQAITIRAALAKLATDIASEGEDDDSGFGVPSLK